jgi:hypothetical protein
VELTAKHAVAAHFWALSHSSVIRALFGLNLLLLLAALLLALRGLARGGAPKALLVLAAVPLAVFFVGLPLAVGRRARALFEGLTEAERRGTYTFDEDGFAWTLGRSPGRASWTTVLALRETDSRCLLLTPGGRAHVIPKAGVSAEALSRLRELAAARGA